MSRNIREQVETVRSAWKYAKTFHYHPAEIERRRELSVMLVNELQSKRRGHAPVHFPSLCA